MKFFNTPNKVYQIGNEQVWHSRSVAVVGIVFALKNNELFILAEKRSNTMMDEPGKWCLPCGYIDWDETGWDALRREIYEETSLHIDDYEQYLQEDNNKKPFFVNTSPDENRQNIALSYCMVYDFPEEEFPFEIEEHKDSEVEKIKWLRYNERDNYKWAFAHDKRINMALEHILKED